MKKMMTIVAVAFLVLGAVIGGIVLFVQKSEGASDCQTWRDCERGYFCYHSQCVSQNRISLPNPIRVCEDSNVNGICDSKEKRGVFVHCWTSPAGASRMAVEGCTGWSVQTGLGDGLDGRLICSSPWHVLVEATDTASVCLRVVLAPGQYIEYNTESDQAPFWGVSGPYPPGEISGFHTATLDGVPVDPTLVSNRMGGVNFRFRRP